ncbi:MAG: SpoVR family protein, partial [Deltaproteobacteria bacterium]|nr:SpoVR family protein [Deltaproteobacteria bacterium]
EEPGIVRFDAKPYMESFINPPEFLEEQRRDLEEARRTKEPFPVRPERDVLNFLMEHAPLRPWQRDVLGMIREEAYYFAPQRLTKIMNEGWASYWHEKLFLQDDRIEGHEVDFARTHAGVTSMPRVGLNPYALGMRLFYYIEQLADKGKYSIEFRRLLDSREREQFDADTGQGNDFLFKLRDNYNDFMFINTFVDQDFINQYKLFVAGRRLNQQRGVWEYYVKSRSADNYRQMVLDTLYHPPCIDIDLEKSNNSDLYLSHRFEGKPLVKDFIANTMLGIEYLWGAPVKLETSEVVPSDSSQAQLSIPGLTLPLENDPQPREIKWQRVRYTMKDRKLSKTNI